MQIARPAASCAHRKLTRQMRLGPRRKGRHLLVADMHPLYLALAADGIGKAVQAVAYNAIDAFHPGHGKNSSKLVCNGFHDLAPGLKSRRGLPQTYLSRVAAGCLEALDKPLTR